MSIISGVGAGLGGAGDSGGPLGSFYSHTIDGSLTVERGDPGRLDISFSGDGDSQALGTFSWWMKRSELGRSQSHIWFEQNGFGGIQFRNDKLAVNSFDSSNTQVIVETDAVFRDSSSWYHFMVRVNGTAGTIQFYVNGVEQAQTVSTGSLASSRSWDFLNYDSRRDFYLFSNSNGSNGNSAIFAEFHFLDGLSYDPSYFGETKDGVWIPKEYSGSHGTNGFYLPLTQTKDAGFSTLFGTKDTSKIVHSDSSSYDIGSSDDFTIEFFFNTSDVGADYGNFMGHYATSGPHHLIAYDFRSSTRYLYWYTGNGASLYWDVSGQVTLVANKWHHVVFQRDGTTLRAYLDGTRLTSVTDAAGNTGYSLSSGKATNFNKAYDLSSITIGDPAGRGFTGYISNVRYVIGATVYADDDSNITVPTATLTAVTGTKLLSCVNGTVGDDISSENNDGSVTSSTASTVNPFGTFNFFQDASGNNNHFSRHNLFDTDVGPDSPTNNFATINANFRHLNLTLSKGNLKHSTSTNNRGVVANFLLPKSGKWYWEHWSKSFNYPTDNEIHAVGINVPTVDIDGSDRGGYNTGITLFSKNGEKNVEGTRTAYDSITGWDENEGCSVLFDADANTISWSVNGGAFGSTVSVSDKDWIPYVGMGGGTSSEVGFFNFGQDGTFAGETTSGGYSDANGIGDFKWQPPSGALALCTSNLPDVTIGPGQTEQADDNFNIILYTGDADNDVTVTNTFAADWVWLKRRSGTDQHFVQDIVRGFGASKSLSPSTNGAEAYNGSSQSSQNIVTTSSSLRLVSGDFAVNSATYVAWTWRAGGSASSNSNGTVTSQVSANTAAGFSICTFTGGSAGYTVGHGLLAAPEIIFTFNRTDTAGANWVFTTVIDGTIDYLPLNDTTVKNNDPFGMSAPTNDVFSLDNDYGMDTGDNCVAYCFHSVSGYSKVSSYVGGGSNFPFIYTGFRPRWLLIRETGNSNSWEIYDTARDPDNVASQRLFSNSDQQEATTNPSLDILSNGFKPRASNTGINRSGGTYIYLAFAEAPQKFANAR